MLRFKIQKIFAFIGSLSALLMIAQPALAATEDLTKVQNFGHDVINILTFIAGILATVIFIVAGIGYITSSGNPERMDKSKQTLFWSGAGLVIVIAANAIGTIVTDLATNSFGK